MPSVPKFASTRMASTTVWSTTVCMMTLRITKALNRPWCASCHDTALDLISRARWAARWRAPSWDRRPVALLVHEVGDEATAPVASTISTVVRARPERHSPAVRGRGGHDEDEPKGELRPLHGKNLRNVRCRRFAGCSITGRASRATKSGRIWGRRGHLAGPGKKKPQLTLGPRCQAVRGLGRRGEPPGCGVNAVLGGWFRKNFRPVRIL